MNHIRESKAPLPAGTHMRGFLSTLFQMALLITANLILSRSAASQIRPAAELQAYPAGVIGTAGASWNLPAAIEITGAAGYNITRRHDFGEHDDERGEGPGLTAGISFFPGDGERGLFLGARTDLWRLEIEWRDDPDTPLGHERLGKTHITVLQPAARAGYRWLVGLRDVRLDATVSLGAEFNINTEGQDVGEGAILLIGVRLGL